MVRQAPVLSLMETEVKARVAVLSRGLDSAAEEGLRTPPARETATADVGLPASWAPLVEAVDAADVVRAAEVERLRSAVELATEEALDRVMVMTVVDVQLEDEEVEAATSETADDAATEEATTDATRLFSALFG